MKRLSLEDLKNGKLNSSVILNMTAIKGGSGAESDSTYCHNGFRKPEPPKKDNTVVGTNPMGGW